MVKTMKTAVFYADILGFSIAATEPGAGRALGQLSDVAHIPWTEDSLAKYLQRRVWNARYGLSDSIFLLARDAADACLAGAEFFFNLACHRETPSTDARIDNIRRCAKNTPNFPRDRKRQRSGRSCGPCCPARTKRAEGAEIARFGGSGEFALRRTQRESTCWTPTQRRMSCSGCFQRILRSPKASLSEMLRERHSASP